MAAALSLSVAAAAGQDVAAEDRAGAAEHVQGVSLELYESGQAWDHLRELVPGQSPNVSLRQDGIEIGSNGVGGYVEHYYLEITGELLADQAGTHEFLLASDDGSRLEIDGRVVIDHDSTHGMTRKLGAAELTAGPHELRVTMFQDGGDQGLRLEWRPPGADGFVAIPPSALRTAAGLTRVVSPGPKQFVESGRRLPPGDGRPLEDVHPMWDLVTLDVKSDDGFEPKIAGMAYLGGGKLAVTTFDPKNSGTPLNNTDGKLWVLHDVDGDPAAVTATLAAEGMISPLGILAHDGSLYVAQRDEITRFDDADGDDVYEQRRTFASGWDSDDYHHFTFGPVFYDGAIYAALSAAVGTPPGAILRGPTFGYGANPPHRGSLMRIDPATGAIEYVAGGLRTPNGLFVHDGSLFVCENQGFWQPSNGINHLRPGHFYGHFNGNARTTKFPDGAAPSDFADRPPTPLAVSLPEDEIANSPTDAVVLRDGPFAGQLLVSDVKLGGLRRIALEKVNGEYQGVAFRHSQGFNAGLNRLALGEGGVIYCGGIGERLSWSWRGTTAGLQRLEPAGGDAFEFQTITATAHGLRVRLTHPASADELQARDAHEISQWRYQPTSAYGGVKLDLERLAVADARAAEDGLSVDLTLPGVKAGRVIHLRTRVRDADGRTMWSPEAWYTMNQLPGRAAPEPPPLKRLLLFTKTAGFRHDNIDAGVVAFRKLCLENGVDLVFTEDASVFTAADLARFDAVAFFSTTGDVLDDAQQAAFEAFVRGGGGFVGVHAAADTEADWPWFGELVGARFESHPKVQRAMIDLVPPRRPSTEHLPGRWEREDEWYNYADVADGLEVLLTLDESTYEGGTMGTPHPIAWRREYGGGRTWYTGGGHTAAALAEPDFLAHLAGGLRWALHMDEADTP